MATPLQLSGELTLLPQETVGNYNFQLRLLCTRGFVNAFGNEFSVLVINALAMIQATYHNPDYLQVFQYKGTKFYCISEFEKGSTATDYDGLDALYVTFLLPEEY